MEIKAKLSAILISVALSSCASPSFLKGDITDVYVDDFSSEDIQRCRPSDVDLSHHEAKEFFKRARQVEYRTIHDRYNYAPCFIEGTLKQSSHVCSWEIRAGATGQITCGKETTYFACDTCEDLFE